MLKHIQSHFYVVTQTHTQAYRDTEKDTSTDAADIYKKTHTFGQTHRDTNKQNTKTNVSVLRLDASILSTYRPTECEKDLQNSNCYIKKKAQPFRIRLIKHTKLAKGKAEEEELNKAMKEINLHLIK